MLDKLNRLGFWPHHVLGLAVAVVIMTGVHVYAVGTSGDVAGVIRTTILRVLIAYTLYTLGAELVMRYAPGRLSLVLRLGLGCLLVAPVSAFLVPAAGWFLGMMAPNIAAQDDRAWLFAFMSERYARLLAGAVLVAPPLWLLYNVPWYSYQYGVQDVLATPEPRSPEVSAGRSAADAEHPPRFVAKLPHEKRGPVWAVTAEQHYLRVYTARGDDLVLMRFSDALDELKAFEGIQIHRSHWIAAVGAADLETRDRRLFVRLKNGVALPVSRPNYAAAKAFFSIEAVPRENAIEA